MFVHGPRMYAELTHMFRTGWFVIGVRVAVTRAGIACVLGLGPIRLSFGRRNVWPTDDEPSSKPNSLAHSSSGDAMASSAGPTASSDSEVPRRAA